MRAFSSLYFFFANFMDFGFTYKAGFFSVEFFHFCDGFCSFSMSNSGFDFCFGLFVILSCLTLLDLDNLVFLIVYLCVYGGI